MDFRHLIVTCLFSKLRLPFDNQKVKENYAILFINSFNFERFELDNSCPFDWTEEIQFKPFFLSTHLKIKYTYFNNPILIQI